MGKKQVLKVVERKTGKVVHEVDVTGKSPSTVEKVVRGMLRNMSEEFYVDDREASA